MTHSAANIVEAWTATSTSVQKVDVFAREFCFRGRTTVSFGDSFLRTQGNTCTSRKGATPNSPISSPRNHVEAACPHSLQRIAWSPARHATPRMVDANAAIVVTET